MAEHTVAVIFPHACRVVFDKRSPVRARDYHRGEHAELSAADAAPLLLAGTCRRADGQPIARRLLDHEGRDCRAFLGKPDLNAEKLRKIRPLLLRKPRR